MIPPCFTLSNIRYVSRVKWSYPGKGVVPSPIPWCSSYWKGSLLIANFIYLLYIALLGHLKEEIAKNWPWMKKKVRFHQDNVLSQVDCNDGKTTWIALWIASTPTLFSGSGLQWLLTVSKPQKNSPGKEISLQWRSDLGNLKRKTNRSTKKGIELLEEHGNPCIILGDIDK